MDVALPLPLQTPFTYRVAERHAAGARARGRGWLVPFGPRRVIGVVTGPASAPAIGERTLKDVIEVLDEAPLVAPPLLDLAHWVADHYLAPPGECYRLVLPPAGVRASRARGPRSSAPRRPRRRRSRAARARATARCALSTLDAAPRPRSRRARSRACAREGAVVVEQDLERAGLPPGARGGAASRPTPRREGTAQAEVLARLRAAGGRARGGRPRARPAVAARRARRGSTQAGVVRIDEERATRAPEVHGGGGGAAPDAHRRPGRRALDADPGRASTRGRFAPFLLHGVTGSGKTEVYFRAAERGARPRAAAC